jgi:hypothetical protein
MVGRRHAHTTTQPAAELGTNQLKASPMAGAHMSVANVGGGESGDSDGVVPQDRPSRSHGNEDIRRAVGPTWKWPHGLECG